MQFIIVFSFRPLKLFSSFIEIYSFQLFPPMLCSSLISLITLFRHCYFFKTYAFFGIRKNLNLNYLFRSSKNVFKHFLFPYRIYINSDVFQSINYLPRLTFGDHPLWWIQLQQSQGKLEQSQRIIQWSLR